MSQPTTAKKPFVFTGRHMLAVMLAFFGTIIGVNLLMAYYATSTWSGLVVPNTYVASQEFNGKAAAARAWMATGIKGDMVIHGSTVTYALTHPQDGPILADKVDVEFRRPVGEHQDFSLSLNHVGDGLFKADHAIKPGEWIVDLTTIEAGRIVFHEARRIHIGAGGI